MNSSSQIKALLRLVDDPDNDVYEMVASQIISYGNTIIPKLEQLWDNTADEVVQDRIEALIHRVHFGNLQNEFKNWCKSDKPSLMDGAILIAKYKFPGLNVALLKSSFEEIKKNIWLELNATLTPLEQINVVNSILYNYYKFEGVELTVNNIDCFFINYLLDAKKGNVYTLGIIHIAVCEMLDIPMFAIDLPRQFVLAYFDTLYSFSNYHNNEPVQQIQFYLDPLNGMIYTQNEVNLYLSKIKVKVQDVDFRPLNTLEVIVMLLEKLSQTYISKSLPENAIEINSLINIINKN